MKQDKYAPIVVVLWISLVCVLHIVLFRAKVNMDISIIQRILLILAAALVTLPLHELIHFLFMKIFRMEDARIERARDPLGLPSLRATAKGEISRCKQLIIFLAPLFTLTIIPDIIFCFADHVELIFVIIASCNAAGCCFDFLSALRLESGNI